MEIDLHTRIRNHFLLCYGIINLNILNYNDNLIRKGVLIFNNDFSANLSKVDLENLCKLNLKKVTILKTITSVIGELTDWQNIKENNFDNLSEVYLCCNYITDDVFQNIISQWKLSNLEKLYLPCNLLTDSSIPYLLKMDLPKVHTINFSNNNFTRSGIEKISKNMKCDKIFL